MSQNAFSAFKLLVVTSQILIGLFSIISGAASRLVNGYDSYGNVCDKINKKLTDHPNSGLDLRGRK